MRQVVLPLAAALLLAGCVVDNPRHCQSNEECALKIADRTYTDSDDGDGFVPAAQKIFCHPTKHYCYAGCTSDSQCQRSELRMNWDEPEKRHCSPSTHHCQSVMGDGGVTDLGTNLPLGAACRLDVECESRHCVEGRCCEGTCDKCRSCALSGKEGRCELVSSGNANPLGRCGTDAVCRGTCDGKGACQFSSVGQPCGSVCTAGEVSAKSCDSAGGCVAGQPKGCGGYACSAAGDLCKTSCAGPADCVAPFVCESQTCKGDLANGQECKGSDGACQSGHCVDGVCCEKESCDDCQVCNAQGKAGTCSAAPDGPAPSGQCPGDAACGGSQCKGGACDYFTAGATCAQSCTNSTDGSSATETTSVCSSTHLCGTPQPRDCKPYLCDAAAKACRTSCATHSDCVAASVCDRSSAHQSGTGKCVDPQYVLVVAPGVDLQKAIDNLGSKTHLRLAAGDYSVTLDISNRKVSLVGVGAATIRPPTSGSPVIKIQANAQVMLQGVAVNGATGAAGNGIQCNAAGTPSKLVVVESTIASNTGMGVKAYECDVSVHRSTITGNAEGGLNLAGGTFVLADNLVAKNGLSGNLGGVMLNQAKAGSAFFNNTVAQNFGGGVQCFPAVDLHNSIVYKNSGSQVQGCTPKYSDVENGTAANNCITDDPQFVDLVKFVPKTTSPCINNGTDASTVTVLDINNTPRKKGAAVDMGAYEVQ